MTLPLCRRPGCPSSRTCTRDWFGMARHWADCTRQCSPDSEIDSSFRRGHWQTRADRWAAMADDLRAQIRHCHCYWSRCWRVAGESVAPAHDSTRSVSARILCTADGCWSRRCSCSPWALASSCIAVWCRSRRSLCRSGAPPWCRAPFSERISHL